MKNKLNDLTDLRIYQGGQNYNLAIAGKKLKKIDDNVLYFIVQKHELELNEDNSLKDGEAMEHFQIVIQKGYKSLDIAKKNILTQSVINFFGYKYKWFFNVNIYNKDKETIKSVLAIVRIDFYDLSLEVIHL
jgi:flagellin-specific chaperone FliS